MKSKDEYFNFGFSSWHGPPALFERFHRHNEVELGLIEEGSMTYLFGSGKTRIEAGQFTVFWGAIPHQLIQCPRSTIWHWLTIPLAWFLQWQLPEILARKILHGEILFDGGPSRVSADLALFNQWHLDLKENSTERRKLVLLEAEARLRRLAISMTSRKASNKRQRPSLSPMNREGLGKVEKMACFIAEHHTEPLRVAQVSRIAGWHPDYAATLFRKTFRMSLVDYLTEHRVSYAQRLLATTDRKVLDIALEAGFGSPSRFYVVFTRICGQSPKKYRASMRVDLTDRPREHKR